MERTNLTEQEIVQGNAMIRIFENPLMKIVNGWVCDAKDDFRLYPVVSLKYHKYWDMLMPVIEKISHHVYTDDELGDTAYPRTFGMLQEETGFPMFRFNRCPLFIAETLIEAAWIAVVDFIKNHNSQNKELTSK